MKRKILQILLDNFTKMVSGEAISEELNVTRAAVWKHIKALRAANYEIESLTGGGYRLMAIPDELSIELLDYYKKGNYKIKVVDSTPSTNMDAHSWAQEGCSNHDMVIARIQENGRGRLSRKWLSPEGGVWMSIILRSNLQPSKASPITLLAALALYRSIIELCPMNDLKIKWPNDIMLNGKKLCGILVELSVDMDGIRHIVVGIGVNANIDINQLSPEVGQTATSLKHNGYKVNRAELATKINDNFISLMQDYEENISLDSVIDEYIKSMAWIGEMVTLKNSGSDVNIHKGILKGINSFGALQIVEGNNTIEIIAGELSLRKDEE